jgi:hypothetical protein
MKHGYRNLTAKKAKRMGGERPGPTVTKIGLLSEPIITTRTHVIKATAASRREVGEGSLVAGTKGSTMSSGRVGTLGDSSSIG